MSKHTDALRGIRAFGPEHFEHLEGLIAERDQLLEAIKRLSFAAMARDNTMGDACALLAAQAALRDANQQARAAIAKATGGAA